jgi:hypothetical protein
VSESLFNVTYIVPNTERLNAVLPPPPAAGMVFHYTSAAGMLGIITDNAIRASSIWSLNDRDEFDHGVKFIDHVWTQVRTDVVNAELVEQLLIQAKARMRVADAFVVCGSTDGRSLSQWRAYGSYVVDINAHSRLQVKLGDGATVPLAQFTEAAGEAQRAVATGWRTVIYSDGEKRAHVRRLFAELSQLAPRYTGEGADSAESFLLAMELYFCAVAFMKDPTFESEHEVRLFAHFFSESPGTRLRVGPYGIVPYLLVESAQDLDEQAVQIPAGARPKRFPIMHVTLGPLLDDPRAAAAGLDVALRLHHFDITPVIIESPAR